MESNKRRESIKNIVNIIQGLKLKNPINQKDVSKFYTFIESEFDEKLEKVEDTILSEIESGKKYDSIESLSKRLRDINNVR